MSSPSLNNVIAVGCVVSFATVFIETPNLEAALLYCKTRSAVMMISFSLVFGALFAKTWRVYKIFTNSTKKTVLKDGQLFGIVGVLVLIDAAILISREFYDTFIIQTDTVETEVLEGGDLVIEKQVHLCSSTYNLYNLAAVFTIKGLLLIFGVFLALQTRKVNIPGLNDSQQIGICIYNVVLLSGIGVVLAFALTHQVDLGYGCVSGVYIFGTSATLVVIFAPKIFKLKDAINKVEDKEGSNVASTITKEDPPGS